MKDDVSPSTDALTSSNSVCLKYQLISIIINSGDRRASDETIWWQCGDPEEAPADVSRANEATCRLLPTERDPHTSRRVEKSVSRVCKHSSSLQCKGRLKQCDWHIRLNSSRDHNVSRDCIVSRDYSHVTRRGSINLIFDKLYYNFRVDCMAYWCGSSHTNRSLYPSVRSSCHRAHLRDIRITLYS